MRSLAIHDFNLRSFQRVQISQINKKKRKRKKKEEESRGEEKKAWKGANRERIPHKGGLSMTYFPHKGVSIAFKHEG